MSLHLDWCSHEAAKHAVLRWPYSRLAIDELSDFEIHVSENTNERHRALIVGTQDELVTALGLAVQVDPLQWRVATPRW
jgi:hypothetical protein